jgi:hypothetical protein
MVVLNIVIRGAQTAFILFFDVSGFKASFGST